MRYTYIISPYTITLPPGLLGYCETNATTLPTNEVAYRVNNILQLLDICQSTILDEELSITNLMSNEKNIYIISQKHHILIQRLKYQIIQKNNKIFQKFNFQHSQITQNEFDKLAKLLFIQQLMQHQSLILEKLVHHYIYL